MRNPRVLGLLAEIVSELKVHRDKISKNNPELLGAFDGMIMKIESEAKKFSISSFHCCIKDYAIIIRIIAFCIDIITKLDDALFYKLSRLQAA